MLNRLAQVIFIGLMGGYLVHGDEPRTILPGSILPIQSASPKAQAQQTVVTRTTLSAGELGAPLDFEVGLKMRNFDKLEARVSRGEQISPSEMASNYEPLPADYKKVVEWLKQDGFTIMKKDSHNMAVFARGSIADISRVFTMKFARVTVDGKEYSSAITAPSVPADLASILVGINGLQPHRHLHSHTNLKPGGVIYGATFAVTPTQVLTAYGAINVPQTGAGQTIAVVTEAFPTNTDIAGFYASTGVPGSINNVQFIQAVSGTVPSPSGEETLDVEWTSAIAPAARIRDYAMVDATEENLDQAYAQIYEDLSSYPSMKQVSISYGLGELYTPESAAEMEAQYFAELASAGVSIFIAAGDGGSSPDITGHENTGDIQVEYPASDINVTSVGGTRLIYDTVGRFPQEYYEGAWNLGGGGISTFFSRPSWQQGTGVPTGNMRMVPDVSANADPYSGYVGWFQSATVDFGGTSGAAPVWAGLCARMNQARASANQSSLGLLNPLIYPLIGTTCFDDITVGSNGPSPYYNAGVGYDLCTGIGTPNLAQLLPTLCGAPVISAVDLGAVPLSGYSYGTAINDAGQVIGQSTTPTYQAGPPYNHAFLASPVNFATPTMTDLGTLPGGVDSFSTGVNQSGQVTGFSTDSSGNKHAFLATVTGTTTTMIDLLSGATGYGTAINSPGQVTGAFLSNSSYHAFLASVTGGTPGKIDFGTLPGGSSSYGVAINDSGQVAGYAIVANGKSHAFIASVISGIPKLIDLGTLPGGTYSQPTAINSLGQVIGYGDNAQGKVHAFLASVTDNVPTIIDLGTLPGGNYSQPTAINNLGQVTGYAGNAQGNDHAFLATVSGTTPAMTDLGTLGGATSRGIAINGQGHVLCSSSTVSNTSVTADYFLYNPNYTDPTSGTHLYDLGNSLSTAFFSNSDFSRTNGFSNSTVTGLNDIDQVTGYGTTLGYGNYGGSNFSLVGAGNIETAPGESLAFLLTVNFVYTPIFAPIITSTNPVTEPVNAPFSYQIGATNSPTSYSYTGTLPLGVSLSNTGLLSGTPTQPGTYTITVTASNSGGTGSISFTLVVAGLPQTISAFAQIADQVFAAPSFTITPPLASSGLPVVVTVLSGPAIISGDTVTPTGEAGGTVVLAANQPGNSQYGAAPQVTTSFAVAGNSYSGSFTVSGSVPIPGSASSALGNQGLAVDSGNNIYLVNGSLYKIAQGDVVTTLGSDSSFPTSTGVAVDTSDNVYVAAGGALDKITQSGTMTPITFYSSGSYTYTNVALDTNGDIYSIIESQAIELTPTGSVMNVSSGNGYFFDSVEAIATDGNQNIYLEEPPDLYWDIAEITPGKAPNLSPLYSTYLGIAVDGFGNLFACDNYTNPSTNRTGPTIIGITAGGVTIPDTFVPSQYALQVNGMAIDSSDNIYVRATNNNKPVILILAPPAPYYNQTYVASGSVNSPFSSQLPAFNFPTSFALTGTLPLGINFNSSTGLLSGTPTQSGTFSLTEYATNGGGTGSTTLTLTIPAESQTIASFSPIPSQSYSDTSFTISPPVSNSGQPVVLSVLSGPATISGNTVTLTGVGTVTLAADAPATGGYSAAQEVTTTFTVNPASASVALGNLTTTYNGTSQTVSITTYPPNLSVSVKYSGSTSPPASAGSYPVTATITNPDYQGSASGVLVIGKANAVLTLNNLTRTYTGSATPVTVMVTPPSLNYAVTYNGNTIPPTNAGSYAVIAAVVDPNGQGSTTGTLVISKATATVTLENLSAVYDETPKAVTAVTNPPGLNVLLTYNGVSSPPSALGSYSILGQVNDTNYQGSASGTLVIANEMTFALWEALYHNLTDLAALDTPEGDGVPTLLKYLCNINPTQPMTAADRAALPVFAVGTNGDLTLTFGEYSLETGITLNVQTSPDLQNWTIVPKTTTLSAGSYTLTPTGTIDPNGDPYMEIDFKPAAVLPKQFIRLNVTIP